MQGSCSLMVIGVALVQSYMRWSGLTTQAMMPQQIALPYDRRVTTEAGKTRTKPRTNDPRFRRTEPDVPRH